MAGGRYKQDLDIVDLGRSDATQTTLKRRKKDKMIFQSPWDSGSFPPLRSDFPCVESCLIKILKPDRRMSHRYKISYSFCELYYY